MKVILFPVLFFVLSAQAQPKIVGGLIYHGSQYGGGIFRTDIPGPGPGIIHDFDNRAPHRPTSGVTPGNADWLYGVLTYNGTNNNGAFYKIKRNGTQFTKIEDLQLNTTSTLPYYHTDGIVYYSNGNAINKYDPVANTINALPVLNGVGTHNLCIDSDDWIYFYSIFSTLAKMKTDGSQYTDIHVPNPLTDGSGGFGGVIETPGDTLFGMMVSDGANGQGTLYSIKKDGTGFTVHHHFTSATGSYPLANLIYFDGKIFGVASQGGNSNGGVLFTINTDGTGYRVVHHFDGSGASNIAANIDIASNGRIFGSFSQFYQSAFNSYKLFKIDTSGENFEPIFTNTQRESGTFTQDVVLADDETIFFTTAELGRHDGGVLNQCDTSGFGAGLYHFGYSANGFKPSGGLIKASDGKLYGTTLYGGTTGNGTIFSMNDDGTSYTKLHEFSDAEGYSPVGKLLEGSDGRLYGVLEQKDLGTGALYRMQKNGSGFQLLFDLVSSSGSTPVGGLVQDNTGFLYGILRYSSPGNGALFRISSTGTGFSILKYFDDPGGLGYPYSGLTIQGNMLYGTCTAGGALDAGGIFRIQTNGTSYEVLHEFIISDGQMPVVSPIVANNGKLYGSTPYGGPNSHGVLYNMNTDGTNYTVLRNFSESVDGAYPWSGVIQATDGRIYGGLDFGSVGTQSTLYRTNLDGSNFTIIRSFDPYTEGGQNFTTIIDLNGNTVLPVKLLAFDAEKKDQTTFLTWKTAQEENSRSFEIERATDGNHFITIGTVAAAGNTNSITNYSFTDIRPLDGVNYYRLKQIDIDGEFAYSKTIPVNFGTPDKMLVSPNPANDQLNIKLPKNKRYNTLSITDVSGRIVLQQTIAGSVIIIPLDIHRLPKGWYVLSISGDDSQQQTFLKQ